MKEHVYCSHFKLRFLLHSQLLLCPQPTTESSISQLIDMTIGLRLPEEEEIKGADLVEHGRTVLAVSDSETSLLKQLGLNVEDVENQQPSLNPQLASHISNAFKDFIHSCERFVF